MKIKKIIASLMAATTMICTNAVVVSGEVYSNDNETVVVIANQFQVDEMINTYNQLKELSAENPVNIIVKDAGGTVKYEGNFNGLVEKAKEIFNEKGYEIVAAFTDEYAIGDVNGDNSIDVFDAVCIAKYSVGNYELTANEKNRADVDDNGVVDVFDAVTLAKSLNK